MNSSWDNVMYSSTSAVIEDVSGYVSYFLSPAKKTRKLMVGKKSGVVVTVISFLICRGSLGLKVQLHWHSKVSGSELLLLKVWAVADKALLLIPNT